MTQSKRNPEQPGGNGNSIMGKLFTFAFREPRPPLFAIYLALILTLAAGGFTGLLNRSELLPNSWSASLVALIALPLAVPASRRLKRASVRFRLRLLLFAAFALSILSPFAPSMVDTRQHGIALAFLAASFAGLLFSQVRIELFFAAIRIASQVAVFTSLPAALLFLTQDTKGLVSTPVPPQPPFGFDLSFAGIYASPEALSTLVACGLVVTFCQPVRKKFDLLMVPPIILVLILGGSRISQIGVILAVLIYVVIRALYGRGKLSVGLRWMISSIVVVSCLAMTIALVALSHVGFHPVVSSVLTGRLSLWRFLTSKESQPWLVRNRGLGNLWEFLTSTNDKQDILRTGNDGWVAQSSHNGFLEAYVAGGLLALLLFVVDLMLTMQPSVTARQAVSLLPLAAFLVIRAVVEAEPPNPGIILVLTTSIFFMEVGSWSTFPRASRGPKTHAPAAEGNISQCS